MWEGFKWDIVWLVGWVLLLLVLLAGCSVGELWWRLSGEACVINTSFCEFGDGGEAGVPCLLLICVGLVGWLLRFGDLALGFPLPLVGENEHDLAPALCPNSLQLAHLGVGGSFPSGQVWVGVSECPEQPHERQTQDAVGVVHSACGWPHWQHLWQYASEDGVAGGLSMS